jgi:hypothetical protein
VTGGGCWPTVNGELLRDSEAVSTLAPPCATADDFPPGRHHGMRRWTSFEVGGINDDWLIGDGRRDEADRCGSMEVAEELQGEEHQIGFSLSSMLRDR